MASPPCNNCPRLQQEINALDNQVRELNRRIAFLRHLCARLVGGIRAALGFIEQEQEHPTMPRRNVVPAIHARLTYIAEQAEGQRV